jgi:two-component system, OmpR family, alkaline phosphatase synthesis response regulator PhoP
MARVMLVEDDPTMVSLLTTLLKIDGFEVIALDADQDIPLALQRECPDALLMDVYLSSQNGLEILRAIRKSNDACKARIIMISGMDLRGECLKAGADGFLLKPFSPDDLVELLNRAIKAP